VVATLTTVAFVPREKSALKMSATKNAKSAQNPKFLRDTKKELCLDELSRFTTAKRKLGEMRGQLVKLRAEISSSMTISPSAIGSITKAAIYGLALTT